nr:protein bassoon-like [Anolis sagrei ordinatus]
MAEAAGKRGPDLKASLGGRSGAEGDPRQPGRRSGEPSLQEPEAGRPAPGDPPPAKSMSNFENPATREFLKAMARPAKVFAQLLQEKERLSQEKEQLMQEKEHLMRENERLLQEKEHPLQEKEQLQASHETEVALLKAEIQRLQQELQEARSQRTRNQVFPFPWFKTDFHIQVLVTGKTGGCENEFLKKVSERLFNIHLKTERYQEGSSHFLLVFCPVATSVGSNMANALKGLGSEPKAVLVMLHHKLKESTSFVDTKLLAYHPAVVRTLHARYTLEDGFYACPINEEAVAIVAKVLEDHCKAGKGDPAIPGALSKSWNM